MATTEKVAHTPGQWEHGELDDTTVYIWASDGDGEEKLIADVKADEVGGFEEFKANCRLVAAAPDLLEVARFAREFAITVLGECKCENPPKWAQGMFEKAEAAILKATGDTP